MSIKQTAYRLRGYLVSLPIIFALISYSFETENDWLNWPIGISIFLFGLFLRIWAQQHLHYRLRVHKRLTMTGPYSFVRNPIYIANIFICLGLVVMSELLWLTPITLIYCWGIYSLAIRYEETHLLDKYGKSYHIYREKVPRWVPKVLHQRDIKIINEYLRKSIVTEIHCFLLLLPFILKEIIDLS
jgi:protein-S-isoprenylcysteine O-methyltransferase Ste14